MNTRRRRFGDKAIWVALGLTGTMLVAQEPPAEEIPPPEFDTNAEAKVVRPAQINLSPELSEVVRLAQSGADEEVVIAYVQNAPAWRISAEEIVYLKDLGISDRVLKAVASHTPTNQDAQNGPEVAPPAPPAPTAPVAPPAPTPTPEAVVPPATPPSTAEDFYEPLAAYGSWVVVEPYGWCWQPSVVVINSGWRPYCDNGCWLWSDCGWYWHSYYSWGWGPFHYGRWFYHPHRRWVWSPDRVWGPSWVSWRYHGDYCGWAPLPPGAHFSVSAGWSFGGRHVSSDFGFGLSAGHFTFVATSHFADAHIAARSIPRREVNVIYKQTTIINNYSVRNTQIINQGVDRNRIEAATRTRIQEVSVRQLPRNAQRTPMPDRITKAGNADVVYRPGPKIEVPRSVPTTTMGKRAAPEHRARELPRTETQPEPSVRRETPTTVPTQPRTAPLTPPRERTPSPTPRESAPAPAQPAPSTQPPRPAPSEGVRPTAPARSVPQLPPTAAPPREQPHTAPAHPSPPQRVAPPNTPPPRQVPARPSQQDERRERERP